MADVLEEQTQQTLMSKEQIEQMFQMFQKLNKMNDHIENPTSIKISEKLTYHNYTKWCKLMHIAIGGRGRLSHITTGPPTSIRSQLESMGAKRCHGHIMDN